MPSRQKNDSRDPNASHYHAFGPAEASKGEGHQEAKHTTCEEYALRTTKAISDDVGNGTMEDGDRSVLASCAKGICKLRERNDTNKDEVAQAKHFFKA